MKYIIELKRIKWTPTNWGLENELDTIKLAERVVQEMLDKRVVAVRVLSPTGEEIWLKEIS